MFSLQAKADIQHVVFLWLKVETPQATKSKVIEESIALKSLSMVKHVSAGYALSSERSIVDDSYDIGIIFEFASQADLAEFLVHPAHQTLVVQTVKPALEKILVYDIKESVFSHRFHVNLSQP
ncbi:Dabb family protein [Catenovulum sediminis]|uniref:Dabb family protein n=1 Tax=Catenovulum sediminis TaxID=1740262 RepID=A0ABV1RF78_9ALTE